MSQRTSCDWSGKEDESPTDITLGGAAVVLTSGGDRKFFGELNKDAKTEDTTLQVPLGDKRDTTMTCEYSILKLNDRQHQTLAGRQNRRMQPLKIFLKLQSAQPCYNDS